MRVIWNAHVTFSWPEPNRASMEAAMVAIQGLTPARRMTTRSSATTVTWSVSVTAWYGRYDRRPNAAYKPR